MAGTGTAAAALVGQHCDTKTRPFSTISTVRTPQDLQATVNLFTAYASALGIDLAFQDFSTELTSMPGKYAPPEGELLLAKDASGEPIGCVALRPLPQHGDHVCEMKRLYVTPVGRASGAGKALACEIIQTAERLGYREMRLDTLSTMTAALRLYAGLGFVEVPAYYETPLKETKFLGIKLPRTTP